MKQLTVEQIARAAVNAMPSTHPGVADVLLDGKSIQNVSLADIVSLWNAASARAGDGNQQAVAWVDERAIAWLANHPKGSITTKLVAVRSVERPMGLYAAAAPDVERIVGEVYAVEINRLRNVIQAACTGGLGHMIERWKELFPDAPVPSALAAAPAAAPAATLTLTGEMHTMGDMGADDMPQPETPRVVIGLADGRNLMVIGLTRDEVVALAPNFLERVTVQVGAAVQAPATVSGSQP